MIELARWWLAVLPHEPRDDRGVVLREALRGPRGLVDRRRRRTTGRDQLRVLALRHGHQIDPERGELLGVAIGFAVEPLLVARGVLAGGRLVIVVRRRAFLGG